MHTHGSIIISHLLSLSVFLILCRFIHRPTRPYPQCFCLNRLKEVVYTLEETHATAWSDTFNISGLLIVPFILTKDRTENVFLKLSSNTRNGFYVFWNLHFTRSCTVRWSWQKTIRYAQQISRTCVQLSKMPTSHVTTTHSGRWQVECESVW